jgi:hypothetical protein
VKTAGILLHVLSPVSGHDQGNFLINNKHICVVRFLEIEHGQYRGA